MEEAKFSLNLKFNWQGYDSQLTLRSDESCEEILKKGAQVIEHLGKMGATGERRWEAAKNNNGKETEAPPKPKSSESDGSAEGAKKAGAPGANGLPAPEAQGQTGSIATDTESACTLCGVVGDMELIGFFRGETYRQAWKCQACGKWLPNDKS